MKNHQKTFVDFVDCRPSGARLFKQCLHLGQPIYGVLGSHFKRNEKP